MKILKDIVKIISFILIICSSALPRPLDHRFFLTSIFLLLIFDFRKYIETISKEIMFKYLGAIFLLLFILFTSLHGYENVISYFSQDGIIVYVSGFIHLICLLKNSTDNLKKIFLWLFCSLVFVISSISILQFFGVLSNTTSSISQAYYFAPIYRSTAFLPHSTALTIWLLSAILYLILLPTNKIKDSVIVAITTVTAILALSATQGRTGFLIITFSLFLALLQQIAKSLKIKLNTKSIISSAVLLILTACIGYVAISYMPHQSENRFSGLFDIKTKHSQRMQENYLGLQILKNHPEGAGPEHISDVAIKIRNEDQFFKDQNWIFAEWRGIHNGYLHYASLWGIAGLFLAFICFLLPFFTKNRSSQLPFLFLFYLACYFLTDNIFYPEISTIFAFSSASLLFVKPDLIDEPKKNQILKISSLVFLIILTFFSSQLVNVRIKQIKNSKVSSLAIDNPTNDSFNVIVKDRTVRLIPPGDYAVLFFKPNSENKLIIQNNITNKSYTFNFNPKLNDLNFSVYWLTTQNEQQYSLLYYKKNIKTDLLEEAPHPYLKAKSFEIYELSEVSLKGNPHFNEESTKKFKDLQKANGQPVLMRAGFKLDYVFRCYEPFQYLPEIGLYYDACLILNYQNYSPKALKQVFINYRGFDGRQ